MKKILYVTTILTSIAAGALAETQVSDKNFYVRIDAGKSFAGKVNDSTSDLAYNHGKLKNSYLLGVGVGTNISENFRSDLTLSTRNYKLDNNTIEDGDALNRSQKIKSLTLMINGYYDIEASDSITPYITAGVGVARNNAGTLVSNSPGLLNATYNSKTSTNLAWQIGAGTAFRLSDNTSLDIGYKYVNLGKIKTGAGVLTPGKFNMTAAKTKLRAQEITAGIRFDF